MTTPYAASVSIGSASFGGYVNAPINGPLSTAQYPNTLPYHSYKTLPGIRPTPPQFYPSQTPVCSDMNVNARLQYKRATAIAPTQKAIQDALGKQSPPFAHMIYSTQRQVPLSSHMNYIAPMPSSMYVNVRKSVAVGKSAYKVGLPVNAPITSGCYYPSGTRSSLRRVRSGGCVAPKKKGAIENTSLRNGAVCAWGALAHQNE